MERCDRKSIGDDSNLDSLQKLVVKKAVFVDDDTFAKASLTSEQARTIKNFDRNQEENFRPEESSRNTHQKLNSRIDGGIAAPSSSKEREVQVTGKLHGDG